MSDKSAIEWTDATWNPVRGCVKVSPGCANCYAETFAERFRGVKDHPYEQGFDLRLVPEKLTEPLRWKKPRRIFVNSMSDLFQDGVPDSYIDQVFAVMALCPQHTFQVLTKRAERMRAYFDVKEPEELLTRWADAAITIEPLGDGDNATEEAATRYEDVFSQDWPLPNVWLGVSVENQPMYDKRIGDLLRAPAVVRFLSVEPMLGQIDMRMGGSSIPDYAPHNPLPQVDWVILGGESGPGARPFDLAWARSIVQQCKTAGVPCFMKQVGSRPDGWWTNELGPRFNAHSLTSKKGGDPVEWPEDLRIREFPVAALPSQKE